MAFQISVSNVHSGQLVSLQVSGDMTVGLLKAVVEAETGIAGQWCVVLLFFFCFVSSAFRCFCFLLLGV